MQFKKWLKDKRVWYGAAAVGSALALFFLFRSKGGAQTASDEGNSDTGYLYFPVDYGSIAGGGNGNGTNDPTASLVDLTKQQITSQTQLGLGAIGSDFMTQILDKLKANTLATKGSGVAGTFGFDPAGMLDFDFSFKAPLPSVAQPAQNVKSTPIIVSSGATGMYARRDRPGNK